MLEDLKESVLKANLELTKKGLVTYTWGNASGIDRNKGLIVIKPSGLPYEEMELNDMVVIDLEGNVVEGNLKPSSDTPTHLVLYKAFLEIGGVVHTHSPWATSWAQAGKDIPCFGTTHCDYFYGSIPCTRNMTKEEVEGEYELQTGNVIVERFKELNSNYIPGVIVCNHGPFAWGKSPEEAVHNAVVMEQIAKMAYRTLTINASQSSVKSYLLDRHFLRKHGANAYYGQNEKYNDYL
ncbi:L-ribulose-5-phosphate 4-epimerase [Clostridium sp. JNZ J1-5]